jgi:type IV pilus assembly protein PilV
MRRNGFTLLEVLIALLVFSLGLLGMAGLLAVSVQTNHSAYLRTQATFLAQGMADRMRANNLALWNGGGSVTKSAYDGTYDSTTAGAANTCLGTASCTWANVVARDKKIWSNQLVSFLPSPSATIACKPTGTSPSGDTLVERPPYSGQCTITIAWNEKSSEAGHADYAASLTWVFQP